MHACMYVCMYVCSMWQDCRVIWGAIQKALGCNVVQKPMYIIMFVYTYQFNLLMRANARCIGCANGDYNMRCVSFVGNLRLILMYWSYLKSHIFSIMQFASQLDTAPLNVQFRSVNTLLCSRVN